MRKIVLAGVLALYAIPALAQMPAPAAPSFLTEPATMAARVEMFQTTPVNPTTVEFAPSADHSTVVDGTTVLTRYDLEIYVQAGTGNPLRTVDLGKPTPSGGLITYTQLQTALAGLTTGTYTAKVTAVGPGGVSRSALSNPFQLVAAPRVPGAPVIR